MISINDDIKITWLLLALNLTLVAIYMISSLGFITFAWGHKVCYSWGVMLCLISHNMLHILYDLRNSLNLKKIYIYNFKKIGVRLWFKKMEAILKGSNS